MERAFDKDFDSLKEQILAMGAKVEQMIELAITGLIERKKEVFEQVDVLEGEINHEHISVDENCLKLLAKHSPLASDLRLVFSIVKINADLERMGDQAVNIARNAEYYFSVPPIKPLVDLPKMAVAVKGMVRDALQSFLNRDEKLARKVVLEDDAVDEFKNSIFNELVKMMQNNNQIVPPALDLILISRNLERISDHATNIAEDTIFHISGEDIRHGLHS